MLGIIIGVLAVTIIVGLGNGLSDYVTASFESLGTDTLNVNLMGRGSTRAAKEENLYEIVGENSEYLESISPTITLNGTVKIGSETSDDTTVMGVSEDYFEIKGYDISMGREISYGDLQERNQVAVVGEYVANTYYNGNAIGQTIRVGEDTFTIVGIMEQFDTDIESGGTDDSIFVPSSTALRISGTSDPSSYIVKLVDENLTDESVYVLESGLYEIYESESAYFVMSIGSILDTMTSMINVLVLVLGGIAAISLVVGGVGIMNIMLVSVTERTREIGVRKSLGAKESAIMQQFVIEAAVTSALGGLIGIALGFAISSAASPVVANLLGADFAISPGVESASLALAISVAIGILFGYLPAKKAAQLNPIDALRF